MEVYLSLNFEKMHGHGIDNVRHMEPIREKKPNLA
jgi:hypothetical protein